ncbi:hypothetical protein MRB53_038553 [Persea americana]|nr:hypothetical protein MRB53_038553 [Persea americana]
MGSTSVCSLTPDYCTVRSAPRSCRLCGTVKMLRSLAPPLWASKLSLGWRQNQCASIINNLVDFALAAKQQWQRVSKQSNIK